MMHPDYSAPVWQAFNDGRQVGQWPAAADVITARVQTPGSRAVMQLQVKQAGQRIVDSRFQVYGCVSAIACGAWLAEWLKGKSLIEAEQLSAHEIEAALQLATIKRHCALQAEDALRMICAQWSQSQNPQTQEAIA